MEKDKLLEEIIKKFDLYKSQIINYDEFSNMYNQYSDKLSEVEFADLLGVKRKTFFSFKSASKKGERGLKILTNRELNNEEKEKLRLELVEEYKLHKDKKISYEYFKKMYKEVKTTLTEIELADLLGISNSNLKNARNTNDKMRVFRNYKLNSDIKEKIRKQILDKYEGKKIYYKSNQEQKGEVDFLELYEPYKMYFSEKEFAELLGISEKNLWYTKNIMANPKIKDIEKIRKIQEIREELEKKTYLSKNEIEEICKKIKISVEDFITYYINNGKCFDFSVYKEALDINNGIYTKKEKLEKIYMEEYKEIFFRVARTVSTMIKKNYSEKYNKDLTSNILVYILENCKDLVENFKYDIKLMERMIWLRARQYAKIIYFTEKKEIIKLESFNDNKKYKINKNDYIEINNTELEKMERNNIDDEQLTEIFKEYLAQGYSKDEILKKLTNSLNVDEVEILDRIKKNLLEKGQVKQNNAGNYEIGDD